jgi:hypothetical protein
MGQLFKILIYVKLNRAEAMPTKYFYYSRVFSLVSGIYLAFPRSALSLSFSLSSHLLNQFITVRLLAMIGRLGWFGRHERRRKERKNNEQACY